MAHTRHSFVVKFDLIQEDDYTNKEMNPMTKDQTLQAMKRLFRQGRNQLIDWAEVLDDLPDDLYPSFDQNVALSVEVTSVEPE